MPGGLALSPGETLEGLAEVRVGLDGLYGLEESLIGKEFPGGVRDESRVGRPCCGAPGRPCCGAPGRGRGPRGRQLFNRKCHS